MESDEHIFSQEFHHSYPRDQVADIWREGVQWVPLVAARVTLALSSLRRCHQGVSREDWRPRLTVWFVRADSTLGRQILKERLEPTDDRADTG